MENDFAFRLKKAMTLRNIKAEELSKKANVPKSAISQYLSGMYEAKQKTIYKLSNALDVSPSWLIGLDVPMEKQSEKLENKLLQLDKYMEENNLEEMVFIPVFDFIDLKNDWNKNPTGYTPFDFKIQNCNEQKNYFYYKVSENSMNIEIGTYILIENTQKVNVNDIILYSINNHVELGIYKLNLKQEKNFKILGKFIK